MKPGDIYAMTWRDGQLSYYLVVEDVDADFVTARRWITRQKKWTKWDIRMQKLQLSSGRRMPADNFNT